MWINSVFSSSSVWEWLWLLLFLLCQEWYHDMTWDLTLNKWWLLIICSARAVFFNFFSPISYPAFCETLLFILFLFCEHIKFVVDVSCFCSSTSYLKGFFKCTAKNVLLQRNHSIDLYALPLMHRVFVVCEMWTWFTCQGQVPHMKKLRYPLHRI